MTISDEYNDSGYEVFDEECHMDFMAAFAVLEPMQITEIIIRHAIKTKKGVTSFLINAQNQARKSGHIDPNLAVKVLSERKHISIYYLQWCEPKDYFIEVGTFATFSDFKSFTHSLREAYDQYR